MNLLFCTGAFQLTESLGTNCAPPHRCTDELVSVVNRSTNDGESPRIYIDNFANAGKFVRLFTHNAFAHVDPTFHLIYECTY